MRRTIDTAAFAVGILANPLAVSLLALAAAPERAPAVIGGTFALALALEYASFLYLNPGDAARKPAVLLLYPFAVALKALLCAAAYVIPFFSTSTAWRGRPVRIGKDSVIEDEAKE